MSLEYQVTTLLFWVGILIPFLLSWWLGGIVKKNNKNLWKAVIVSVLISASILAIGGYYWYFSIADMIGKGIAVFIYTMAFFLYQYNRFYPIYYI
jgi:hypothetical protein